MKYQFLATLLCAFFLVSCNKEVKNSDSTNILPPVIKKAASIPPNIIPVNITQATNGDFISSYKGGISFSSVFPHSLIVDGSGATDGEPIVGYSTVSFAATPTLTSTIDGSKFDIIQPTFPGAVTMTQVTNYFASLRSYWADKTGTVAMPAPLGSSTGAGGVWEIKGQVVRDHNSPTNASVVPDTYVYNYPPIWLSHITKAGYTFKFFGTLSDSGMILKITGINSSNSPVTITSFSVQDYLINAGNNYQLIGFIKLSNGTVINLNDVAPSDR